MIAKLVDPAALEDALAPLRRRGGRLVFTNGCFDILHAGHVRYLTAARAEGDALVVGLNSDASVRIIKGDRRPIVGQMHRAEVLAGLTCVDYIALFDAPDPLDLIKIVRPHVLVKGADWPEEQIIGADFVRERGGRVARIPLAAELSTTRIIERVLERYGGGGGG